MSGPGAGRRVTFRDVLANREFRALFLSQALSLLGDQLAKIAVALLVFQRSHSPLLTALTYAVTFLPWAVGGPLLSAWADRLPRQRLMIISDLVRGVLILGVALPHLPIAGALLLVFAVSTLDPPFQAARGALVPEILPDEREYTVASALMMTTSQLAQVLGFGIGGALVAAVSARGAIVIDSVTFFASAVVVATRLSRRAAPASSANGTWAAMREAAHYVRQRRRVLQAAFVAWGVVLATIAPEAVAVPYAKAHGGGAVSAGLLTAALPLGAFIGAMLVGRILQPEQGLRLLPAMALATPVLLTLTAFNPAPVLAALLWVLAGVTSACVLVAGRVLVVESEPQFRGRVLGIAGAGMAVAQGVGALVVGVVASHISSGVAVADTALPVLAMLVVLFTALPWRSSRTTDTSIPEPMHQEQTRDADAATSAGPRSLRRPLLLAVGLLCVSALGLFVMRHDDPTVPSRLAPLWLLVLFFVVRSYPLFFEFRNKLLAVSLDSVPLLLCLFFLSPLVLFGVRVGADIASIAVQRKPRLHALLNASASAFYSVTIIAIFHALSPSDKSIHFALWLAAVGALICDNFVSAGVTTTAAFLLGRPVRLRELGTPLAFSTLVMLVNACLGLVTANAVVQDASTMWAITVFVILALVGFRTYHRLADQHAVLDRLYAFTKDLGPISADRGDLVPALTQLRLLVRASELELTLLRADAPPLSTAIVDEAGEDRVRVREEPLSEEHTSQLARAETQARSGHGVFGWRRRRGWLSAEQMSVPVAAEGRTLGILRATSRTDDGRRFEREDLHLLEAVADQLAAALEKGKLIESLRVAATRDSLTALPNLDSLREFLSAMLHEGSSGVLLLLDIDRFHDLNETLGHDAGDSVLTQVARRLEDAAMQGSLASRVGADQFALVIPGQSSAELARLAALAVKSRVDGPLRLADVSADVRMTVGIARAPEHGTDAATLLRRAEIAMGTAKGGATGISEWEPEMERDGSRRLYVLSGLRQALADSDLRVEFQPKLRLGTGDVTGFEALVRWRHPDLGLVPPNEFIPLAEATGLIGALTSGVLRMSLETCRRWHDQGKPVTVAVNISARSLDDPVLVGQVAALLTASGLESRWLTLEITESSVMQNPARSIEVLRQLRSLGVGLSIDDFGTGYSSLHQLRGLPVHEVKIDKTFVDNIGRDGADRAVVRAVVELCESLGLTTVAEGVEHAEQAYALESLGVKEVQGYFYGRPMTESDATTWLRHRTIAAKALEERQRG